MNYRAAPFFIIGIAFIAMGVSVRRTFSYMGIVFLVLAVVMFRKR